MINNVSEDLEIVFILLIYYLINLTAAVDSATPKLNTFMRYAKVELVPPTPAEVGGVAQGFTNIIKSAQTGAWKKMPVKVRF